MVSKISTRKLIAVDKAKKIMINSIKTKINVEYVSLIESEDRILAENIHSKFNIPELDNAAVDGFAVNYISIKKKIKKFKIIGVSSPGQPFNGVAKIGEAIRIFTGAYLLNKNNVNTIIMEEDCNFTRNYVELIKFPESGSNIRKKGEDIKKKQLLFDKGRKIRTVDLAQLSSIGLKRIKVYKKLKVGIFSTGNELSNSDKKSKFAIYDANKVTLMSMFKKIGCDSIDLGIIKDNLNQTKKLIFANLNKCDLIVTTGGVSSSQIDKISQILKEHGEIGFWRLAIKPGRPLAFGKFGNTPFIGLPGNPVASIVTFFMLVIDYVKKLSGNNNTEIIERLLPSCFEMKKKIGRKEWLRGKVKIINNKKYIEKFHTTGSGILSSISKTDGIIEIDENKKVIKKGTILKFYRYEDMLN